MSKTPKLRNRSTARPAPAQAVNMASISLLLHKRMLSGVDTAAERLYKSRAEFIREAIYHELQRVSPNWETSTDLVIGPREE